MTVLITIAITHAQNVTIHLSINDTTARVIYMYRLSTNGSLTTDTLYYIPGKSLINKLTIGSPTILHFATESASHLPVYIIPETSEMIIECGIVNGRFNRINFIGSKSNTYLNQYSQAAEILIQKFTIIQECISRYPFNDDYTKAIHHESSNSLKNLLKLKQQIIGKLPKQDKLIKAYISQHYELLSHSIKSSYNSYDYYKHALQLNNDTLLLATEIPDIITGLLDMAYQQLNSNDNKQRMLDSIEVHLKSSILHPNTQKRLQSCYLNFINHNKLIKRIDMFTKNNFIPHGSSSLMVGNKVLLNGKTLSEPFAPMHTTDFRKKYNVVFIWSTDCGHCKRSIESMNTLYTELKNSPVQFYSFNIGINDTTFTSKLNWKLKGNLSNGWNNSFLTKFRINYTPVILILNESGVVLSQLDDTEKLRATLNELLD